METKKKKVEWSPSQLDAINTKAKKILISASAGSGKSTVLTERIITSLLSDDRDFDISRLLVVTFTNESAADLKYKISEAMRDATDERPENKRISEQLIKLPSAKINTIHSLCLSIIKNNATELGLSPSMRVADESEITALKTDVMNRLLEDAYSGSFAPTEGFADFFDNFVSDKDEKLADMFFKIYEKLKNDTDGVSNWENAIEKTELGKFMPDDPFCKLICKNAELATDYAVMLCTQAIEYFNMEEAYHKAIDYFKALRLLCARLNTLASERNYRGIRDLLLSYELPPYQQMRKDKTDEGEYYRSDVKKFITEKILKEYKEKTFCFSDEDIEYLSREGANISRSILHFIIEFDRRFSAEKAERSVLDYNDMEHKTIQVLYYENSELKPYAYELSSSFDEIYVDEYQDVNPLQNKIFEALSVNAPIFMVGDIKQSIYGFRGAMPEIFSHYRRTFSDVNANDPDSTKIFLSKNYRSDKKILEFSNTVSDGMFKTPNQSCFDYRIPYSTEDRMLHNGESKESPDIEILIADTKKSNDSTDDESKDDGRSISAEAQMVSNRIRAILDTKKVKASEIAILMRSATKISEFQRALRANGIPVMTSKGASLFDNPEIQLALCLLNCVDNSYRDIFLSGALKSPIFGFTFNDLITVRSENKDIPLYDALTDYVYTHDHAKGRRFLSFLERMRSFALSNPIDKVLWRIYTETSFFSVIRDKENISESDVARRRANLIKLHSIACDFAGSGKNDLYSFVERLRKLAESSDPPKGASDEGDGVQIKTIHASKGLEFKHCFICGTGTKINDGDQQKSTIYNSDLGIAAKIKDALGFTMIDTPHRRALSAELKLLQRDEEMRVLYVALTRAQKAMYITAEVKDAQKLLDKARWDALNPHPMVFLKNNTYLSWILTALKMKTDLSPRFVTRIIPEEEIFSVTPVSQDKADITDETPKIELDTELYNTLSQRLSFKYPFVHSANIPSKLAVSRLYPEILDQADEEAVPDYDFSDLPFILSDKDDIPGKLADIKIPKFIREGDEHSGSERGTATHVFMQFCDFDMLEKNGIESEIQRLCDKRFILPSMAELVNRRHIEDFLKSSLYSDMKKAINLNREYRFNIKLPASDFTTDPELKEAVKDDHIFVQGVVDCYYKTSDGRVVLLDYKTDKVPREALGNKELEDAFFTERYLRQLSYYKTALERLIGRNVDEVIIYSFALGRTIRL